jgi:hypothetical protein
MWKQVKALRVFWPRRLSWRQMLLTCLVIGLVVGAFFCGRMGYLSPATAQQSHLPIIYQPGPPLLATSDQPKDPRAPVARVYGDIPITRQELGEYLIERFGPERLEFLVNRKIVELACKNRGIDVTEADIEAQLIDDLKTMNMVNLDQFVGVVLKKFGKTLYEYKEDVLRPKIAMIKLCSNQVQVSTKDIEDQFEAKYGPMVQCRLLMFGKDVSRTKQDQIWAELKDDKDGIKFRKYAKEFDPPQLGSHEGEVPPIHKHFPDKRVEDAAFALQVGEISGLLPMPDDSTVILRCENLISKRTDHRIEDEWQALHHEVFDRKLSEAIPKMFQAMRDEAKPFVALQREEPNRIATQRVNAALVKAAQARPAVVPPPVPQGINVGP